MMQAIPSKPFHLWMRYERKRWVSCTEEDVCCVPFNEYQEAFLFDVYRGFTRLARRPLRGKPSDLSFDVFKRLEGLTGGSQSKPQGVSHRG